MTSDQPGFIRLLGGQDLKTILSCMRSPRGQDNNPTAANRRRAPDIAEHSSEFL
jgi:hypothetical protein